MSVSDIAPVNQEMMLELDEEFAGIKENNPGSVNVELIKKLANDYGFRTGKWMLMHT